jgi:hypothetical protein
LVWFRKILTTNLDLYVIKHVSDNNGNQYVTGKFAASRITFDSTATDTSHALYLNKATTGTNDLFMAKYNLNGTLQWVKLFGGINDENVVNLSYTNDKLMFAGSYGSAFNMGSFPLNYNAQSDGFLTVLDLNGNVLNALTATGKLNDAGNSSVFSNTARNYTWIGEFYSDTVALGSIHFINNYATIRDGFLARFGCFDSVTVSITPESCSGNGSLIAIPSMGNEPYTYKWSNGDTTSAISNLVAGTYTVTVTGTNGCSIVNSAIVVHLPILQASITNLVNVNCAGTSTGSATVTAIYGSTPYAYKWSTGAITATLSNVPAGTYYVSVNDQCKTIIIDTAVISSPPNFTAIISGTNVTCGGNDGSATVIPSGGTPAYTYLWSNSQTTATISNLSAGTYSVTVSDASSCSIIKSISLTSGPVLSATINGTNISCNGGNNGTASVTPSGGTSPYTYIWSNSATTQSISSLMAGTYQVTVKDACNNSVVKNITLTQPSALTATISQTNINCSGGSNGSATAIPSGGTPGYSYLWSNSQTTATISNLSAGIYTVTISDANSCTTTQSVTIISNPVVNATISGTNITCRGGSDGTATVSPYNGGTPYTYIWSNSATTQTISNLAIGTYRVTVKDACNATIVKSITLTQPAALAAVISGTNITCRGSNTGTATVTPSSGTSPYTYLWNTGATTQTISNLVAGTYTVTVSDACSATIVKSKTLTQPAALAAVISGTNITCRGSNTGTATVTPSSGTSPYTYHWNTGATTQTISNLVAGTYTVTVSDACSATIVKSKTLTQPAALAAVISGTNVTTCNNGTATVTPSSGTSPYTYLWNTSATTQTISNLVAGTYTVTVTDACNATIVKSKTLTQPVLAATVSGTNITCRGSNTGTATVTPSSGTSPYTYLWNTSATTQSISGLIAGTYSVTVTDACSSTIVKSITLTQPNALVATISGTNVTTCNNGTATVTPSSGTSPYTYLWNTSATTQTISNLVAGTYTVTVTDACNATIVKSKTLTQPVLAATVSGTNITCRGSNTGTATVTPSSGTSPYTYLWNTSATTQSISGLIAGTYSVTVTDACNTTIVKSKTLTQPAALTASITTTASSPCQSTGTAVVTATYGTSPYTYLWNTGDTSKTIINLAPAQYKVTVTDACSATKSVSKSVGTNSINIATVITCTPSGTCQGSIAATVTGGNTPYSYLWNDPSLQTTQTAVNLCIGTYKITVTDALGCTKTKTNMSVANCAKSLSTENEDFSEEQIVVYPNPAKDFININFPVESLDENVSVEIYDITGSLIYNKANIALVPDELKINLHSFSNGVYMVKIIYGDTIYYKKLILNHL